MLSPSDIRITINDQDLTDRVLFSSARFEGQLGAMPGTADVTIKDDDQTLDFTTGDEMTLTIDGVRQWGGFILSATRTFAFPAVDTTDPDAVTARQWKLTGVDYNILFDKRIVNNPDDPTHHLPFYTLDKTMGELLRTELFTLYLDLSGDGLDTTTYVDDMFAPRFDADGNPDPNGTKDGSWPQQGSTWRQAMEDFAQFGAVYYIDADKNVHFHAVETTSAAWGFSDVPNFLPLPDASATYGMREFEEIEDATALADDAFVWGGSEWAGASGGTVFARKQNTSAIDEHGRWQYAETRFGELKDQGMVTARANVIVSGNTTGAVGGDTARGLAVDQKQIRMSWFAHAVPTLGGNKAHLRPSDVVTTTMYVLGTGGVPLTIILPLRSVRISFPTLPSSGVVPGAPMTFVRFDGFFGVQLSDPWWLWKYLRDISPGGVRLPQAIATADGTTTAAIYGTIGNFSLSPSPPDGVTTIFTIPFAYVDQTIQVYKNGRLLIPDTDYTESSPETGEITFTTAPTAADALWATCRIAGGYS